MEPTTPFSPSFSLHSSDLAFESSAQDPRAPGESSWTVLLLPVNPGAYELGSAEELPL